MATAPSTLGKYHLIKKIAAGGMAEIYLARVTGLAGFEKVVVVKRILPQLSTQSQFIEMFLDEARIAATLQHPNIVQMYDIGAADGNYFIAMEYLHGEDVRSIYKRLRERKLGLPLDHALNIVIGVASGLHHAHDKAAFDGKPLGIVHRDVTPQNVIVTYEGAVKLVDFGIAKASNRLSETRFGTLKGKIPYMSPEQCQGRPLDRRSDIYAVGIMLYELTTASRLYRGESDYEIMKQIVEQPLIPPSVRRADYPIELERVVMRALAKDPDERYQNVQDLQGDLERYVRHERLMVSTIALSAFMKEMFPERATWRPEQAQSDDELSAKVGDRTESETDPDVEISIGDDDRDRRSSEVTSSTPSVIGQLGSRPSVVIAPPRRTGLIVALLLLLVLAGGAGAWWLTRDDEGGDGAGPVAAAVTPSPAAPPGPDAQPSGPPAAVVDAGAAAVAPVADAGVVAAEAPADAGASQPVARVDPRLERKKKRDRDRDRKPPDPVDSTPGELRVVSSPACLLIVDGKSRGETPVGGIRLAPGKHTLQLVNPRHGIDRRYGVTVKPGEVVKRSYTFPIDKK